MVRIEGIAAGGDGVGRLADGRTVFVPRSAPGDLVELDRVRRHSRFAKARVSRLVEDGLHRAVPICAHYREDDCGGCQLQHLSLDTQLAAKRMIVADALRRIGGLEVEVPPVVASEKAWHYRSRITLAVGPGRRHTGYHVLGAPGRIFPLERCELASEALMRLWQGIRPLLGSLPADAEHLMLREDRDGALHVLVRSRGQVAWTGWRAMADHLAEARIAATVWWHPAEGAPRAMGGLRGASPATVFEQVHPAMGDRVRAHAIEQLGSIAGLHLWDLYAGIGETTDRLAAAGATVESVEVESRAVECAERRWRSRMQQHAESQRPAPTGVVHHAGRVEEVIHHLRRPDAVVANPPRGGLGPGVVAEIAVRRPGRVVYVSCDPATLARDLKLLCAPGGPYRLVAVQPFDLFPQTAHVETVAALELT